jgi:hypothetical protein
MDSKDEIDGREATRVVQNYFMERYGQFGVNLFGVESVEFDEKKKVWTIICSFYRTLAATQEDFYSITVRLNGKIGSVKKLPKEQTRQDSI